MGILHPLLSAGIRQGYTKPPQSCLPEAQGGAFKMPHHEPHQDKLQRSKIGGKKKKKAERNALNTLSLNTRTGAFGDNGVISARKQNSHTSHPLRCKGLFRG